MLLPHSRHLDEALDSAVTSGAAAGVVVAVTDPHATIYEGAFGWADLDRRLPMRRDSVFRIASMTKLVTSIAVLMLRAEGKVGLDDALAAHLPGYEQPPVLVRFDKRTRDYATRPAVRPVTLRQLLAHTSGYGYWFLSPEVRAVAGDDASNFEAPFLLHDPGDRFTYGIGRAPGRQLRLGRHLQHILLGRSRGAHRRRDPHANEPLLRSRLHADVPAFRAGAVRVARQVTPRPLPGAATDGGGAAIVRRLSLPRAPGERTTQ